jgi:hypothetical protein
MNGEQGVKLQETKYLTGGEFVMTIVHGEQMEPSAEKSFQAPCKAQSQRDGALWLLC